MKATLIGATNADIATPQIETMKTDIEKSFEKAEIQKLYVTAQILKCP